MKISFHGAARTVTGSKHLLQLDNGKKILLDCGLFQGLGTETSSLNERFGFDPTSIDVVLLSHAHIDHSGLLPKLVKDGFAGQIICTGATRDLAEILLYDSAEIQMYEAEIINRKRAARNQSSYEPLYTAEDVKLAMQLFVCHEFDEWIKVVEGVDCMFTNAGHLAGSAALSLRINESGETTNLLFSGDVGRYQSVLLPPPVEPAPADIIILESTYGDKRHDISFNTIEELYKWIKKVCVQRGGQLIIPAFSIGRTQEVLYALNQLHLERRLPELKYFVDSPLSLKATETIKRYNHLFNDRIQQVLAVDDDPFDFPGLKFVESVEDSRRLVDYNEPCVIISASGTADAGRVRHHLFRAVTDAKNAILFVGYCGEQSLGGQLLSGTTEVEILSELCCVEAEIGQLTGMSAHGDTDDLTRFLNKQDPSRVETLFLVHGEYGVQKGFADRLSLKGYNNIVIPSIHEVFDFGKNSVRVAV